MVMFGAHLVLGLVLLLPFILFGIVHIKNSHDRPNRRAVRVGYLLFAISLVLLFSGLALMRFDLFAMVFAPFLVFANLAFDFGLRLCGAGRAIIAVKALPTRRNGRNDHRQSNRETETESSSIHGGDPVREIGIETFKSTSRGR
jgi:hypothetical protein